MDGWSQWYFKYWLDRKSLDDKRKIARKMILWKGLKANLLKWSNILMVEFMIILLQLILDKFYCIGYQLLEDDLLFYFFVYIKMSYNFLIDKHYCGKPKTDIILVVVKENLLNIILKIKKFREKMQKESMV